MKTKITYEFEAGDIIIHTDGNLLVYVRQGSNLWHDTDANTWSDDYIIELLNQSQVKFLDNIVENMIRSA